MSNECGPSYGVMEGKGAYNRHATLPADGAAHALPLLEKAMRDVELDSGDKPIVIADYGSSFRGRTRWPRCRLQSGDCAIARLRA